MNTHYAPAERDELELVLEQIMELSDLKHVREFLSALSIVVLVLNDKRQVVFANDELLKQYNISDHSNILGFRPGEVMACIHADEEEGGCGTSESCRYCGVVNTIVESKKESKKVTRETRITIEKEHEIVQVDLAITAKPFKYKERIYTIYSAEDITHRKQMELLERIFFHDIINLAGSLDGIMELMDEMDNSEREKFLHTAKKLSNQLIDEITTHQDLRKAEHGELTLKTEGLVLKDIIEDVAEKMRPHKVAKNKTIKILAASGDEGLVTDRTLLMRVLMNMLKNALEASKKGEQVEIKAERIGAETVRFSVSNAAFMPKHVQQQIFQRSFSTKGQGRGLGTYSMKLLGEKYLKGKLSFVSVKEKGTSFTLELPVNLNGEHP